jgi:hypothetical protein
VIVASSELERTINPLHVEPHARHDMVSFVQTGQTYIRTAHQQWKKVMRIDSDDNHSEIITMDN